LTTALPVVSNVYVDILEIDAVFKTEQWTVKPFRVTEEDEKEHNISMGSIPAKPD
jgi:hypothetical protein